MKKLFKFLPIALLGFCLALSGCSEEQNTEFSSEISSKSAKILIVPENEIMDFDSKFQEDYQIGNLNYDSLRESYLDLDANELFIPIKEGYTLNFAQPDNDIKNPIKEAGAGIKFKIARLNPRENPTKCQGKCKCGVGFKCGNEKYIYAKSNLVESFDFENREASGRVYIDIENNFLIIRFDTVDIPWVILNEE